MMAYYLCIVSFVCLWLEVRVCEAYNVINLSKYIASITTIIRDNF